MVTFVRMNLNTATREELDFLLDLGPDLSEEIVRYREQNGPFKNWEEVKEIEGITDNLIRDMQNKGATL